MCMFSHRIALIYLAATAATSPSILAGKITSEIPIPVVTPNYTRDKNLKTQKVRLRLSLEFY